MSLGAWGDEGPDGIDIDELYANGWESDPDATVFWRTGEPEDTYTMQQACEAYRSKIEDWLEDYAGEDWE